MEDILAMLSGGDRRSTGKSAQVVAIVSADPGQFAELFSGLDSPDPVVRMRAADALEKITARRPELLQAYKTSLLDRAASAGQQELRWHFAQMLPRLELAADERRLAVEILLGYLDDKSRIVKTFAMQALAVLAAADADLKPQVVDILAELTRTGSPAMQSRGKKLLSRLK